MSVLAKNVYAVNQTSPIKLIGTVDEVDSGVAAVLLEGKDFEEKIFLELDRFDISDNIETLVFDVYFFFDNDDKLNHDMVKACYNKEETDRRKESIMSLYRDTF